jgi:hypothetical protein
MAMRKILAIALLAFFAVGVVAGPADAWRGHHGSRVFVGVGFGFYGYPYYGYPYYGYPYSYYPPAMVYTAPPVYTPPAPAQAAPAIQREVVYSHGKYVLEGDGVNTAYRWVWIANITETPQPSAPAPAAPSETR